MVGFRSPLIDREDSSLQLRIHYSSEMLEMGEISNRLEIRIARVGRFVFSRPAGFCKLNVVFGIRLLCGRSRSGGRKAGPDLLQT
jgi:hypothetical protein